MPDQILQGHLQVLANMKLIVYKPDYSAVELTKLGHLTEKLSFAP
jgi:hypothetical protein